MTLAKSQIRYRISILLGCDIRLELDSASGQEKSSGSRYMWVWAAEKVFIRILAYQSSRVTTSIERTGSCRGRRGAESFRSAEVLSRAIAEAVKAAASFGQKLQTY